MKLRYSSLQVNEKTPYIFLNAFCLHFLRILTTIFPVQASKVRQHNFFQEVEAEKKCYLLFTCSIPIHLSQPSSCWIWHLTFCFWRSEYSFCYINWNSSFLTIITKHLSFCSVFWCKFFKKAIVLHHGDNNFLFYFDIAIKFTFSTITSKMKKW